MIIYFLISLVISILGIVFGILPNVDELPFGIDETLVSWVGIWNNLISLFPPLGVMKDIVLWYLGFRLLLIVLKAVLGSRTPVHN